MVLMPKYAVVIVLMAVNALVRIATMDVVSALSCEVFQIATAAPAAIARSPLSTTQNPVQARVRWTPLSLGSSPLVGRAMQAPGYMLK
jgi:hypothetical protein